MGEPDLGEPLGADSFQLEVMLQAYTAFATCPSVTNSVVRSMPQNSKRNYIKITSSTIKLTKKAMTVRSGESGPG